MSDTSVVASLKQPEYVGENRCMPCTIANSVIAVVGSAALSVALVWADAGVGVGVAAAAGVVALGASATTIYLRGYLVPYTPTLTKRYFPDWLLAKFDKLPEESPTDRTVLDSDVDPERVLLEVGAVEPCAAEDDLCLAADVRERWRTTMRRVESAGVDTDDIVRVLDLDLDSDDAALNRHGRGVLLSAGTREVGKWESDAALVADVAAAEVLEQRYADWDRLTAAERSRLLRGLRIFAEACPLCEGAIEFGQHTVESCCRSYDVVAVTCHDCQSRLFEQRADQVAAAD
jgi:hypothetical protein